jgi:uncharacterized membrane protein YebE (DUF533 family)
MRTKYVNVSRSTVMLVSSAIDLRRYLASVAACLKRTLSLTRMQTSYLRALAPQLGSRADSLTRGD